MSLPILYSFRRCPYAMRARLAIWHVGIPCVLREVVLRDKPPSMLEYSSKGTVPVLVLADGTVIDESLDVMFWALNQAGEHRWLRPQVDDRDAMLQLIAVNDGEFKYHLDRYKYPDRYDGVDAVEERQFATNFLERLEARLLHRPFLFGDEPRLADYAIVPFIRQFANTDREWFDETPYPRLRVWLAALLEGQLFNSMMHKYPQWRDGDAPTLAP